MTLVSGPDARRTKLSSRDVVARRAPDARMLLALALVQTLSGTLGCEDVRAVVHEMTKPSASPDAAVAPPPAAPPPVVDAGAVDAGSIPSPGLQPSASASPDAGKPVKARTAPTPTAKKVQPPKLNGLPPGAICLQSGEGNGGCASGSECAGGRCTCLYGWTVCNGACRDLSRDPYNCDKCGHECDYGQYCRWGNCE